MKYLLLELIYKFGNAMHRFSHLSLSFLSCGTLKCHTDEQHNVVFSSKKSTLV